MSEQASESRGDRFLRFCKKVALVVGLDTGLSLMVWLIVGFLAGHFDSPARALFWGAWPLFFLAMLPFFYDMLMTLALPVRMLIQKETARSLLEQDRPRSERGISLTFLFFTAGMVMMLFSFLAGLAWGG